MTHQPADAAFAEALSARLPPNTISQTPAHFLEEPRGKYPGRPGILARPRSVKETATIIRAAGDARVPVIPYGGGTGLVGGQTLGGGAAPLVISLERMDKVRAVYPDENVLIAEAGAILANVQAEAEHVDRLFPLSLASEGTAQIGGLLATNAGGVNVLRYGSARDLCLGLEAVLPGGEIWHGLRRLRKDNTGYDLRGLLIGAEGTLGVITAAALKLSPRPANLGTAFLHVANPAAALEVLSLARAQVGEAVSAFELIHRQGLDFVAQTLPDIRQPFADAPEWSVLVEFGLSQGSDPTLALECLFETAAERNWVLDGVIAQSEAQRDAFWSVREHIPEANRRVGAVCSHDISLPLGNLDAFITRARKAIQAMGDFRINCFGHVGDGNLHFNVFPPRGQALGEARAHAGALTRCIHDLVHQMDGSFSAEHGLGRAKVGELERYGDPAKLNAMQAIKAALDPVGIMNPGAVLRDRS